MALRLLQSIEPVESRGAIAFGHGGVIEDVVDEIFHRASIRQDRLADMDQFGCSLADDMNSEEGMGISVKDHL